MRVLFAGSCCKDPSGHDINEDKWAYCESHGTLALCDGASEFFDSAVWARILADRFKRVPAVTPEWLADAVTDYVAQHDFNALSWSGQASYRRGSFSTLLGARHDSERQTIDVLAVGDSLAVLVDNSAIVSCWPYFEAGQFKERPTLFATLTEHNAFVLDGAYWKTRQTRFDLSALETPRLVCVTDALGEWLLRQSQSDGDGLARLLAISTETELADLVVRERQAGRMKIDDSTLIIAAFDKGKEPNGLPDL